ncbi:MAG: hypothetical protein IH609_03730 [Dehalococcoidia bacterium]|nr:hypothetical protein [Dehalococcoidia bacterium]
MWSWRKNRNADANGPAATPPTSHPFSADRAITSASEDRLNRKGFAYAIADALANWRQKDSLVVGIFGPWGVGKTSIVNMAKERLERAKPAPLVMDFSPWEWAGHQELAEAFFEELEKSLSGTTGPQAANVAEKVRKYALALHAGAALAQAVAPVVTAVSVLVTVFGISLTGADPSLAKWGGWTLSAFGAAGVVLGQSHAVMSRLAESLERGSSQRKLSQVKRELADALRVFGRTIVVVVDDIDRLTPTDAVRMLQIVKANADLPGVVFVIPFDQDAVARSVTAALKVDGRAYLEKVVQVGFDVPAPDAAELGQLFIDGLNKAIEPTPISDRFDSQRWRDLYSRGLLPYLTTPRRVIRFASMAEFGLARHVDGDECNVDPVDFLGVEALREFEPNVYAILRNSVDAVTGTATGDSHAYREKSASVAPLLSVATKSHQKGAAEWILRQLFPAVEWAASNVGQGINRNRQLEQRRVGHERTFDRYFQFTVPTKDLSDGELARVIALATQSKDELVSAFRNLMATGHMVVFLIRVQGAPDKVPDGAEPVFMAALFDVGDDLPNRVETLLGVSDLLLAEFIVESLLERWPPDERVLLFREAMNASIGVILPIEVVRLQMHRHERDRSPAIAQSELEELLSELVSRVVALADSGALLNHRHLAPLLYAWDQVEPDGPRPWTEEQAAKRAGLARLIMAFDRHARDDGRHPLVRYIDLDAAKERARQWLEEPDLDPEEKAALEAFLAPPSAWDRLRRGTPELDEGLSMSAQDDDSDIVIDSEEQDES